MKALSIKQPYASLIAHGIKDIENRTWKTNFRGRIYIHASADKNILKKHLSTEQLEVCARHYDKGVLPMMHLLPLSAIIGEVDIIDCVLNHDSIWAEQSYSPASFNALPFGEENEKPSNVWNWVLANTVVYDEPILNVKGKLSLWEVKP